MRRIETLIDLSLELKKQKIRGGNPLSEFLDRKIKNLKGKGGEDGKSTKLLGSTAQRI